MHLVGLKYRVKTCKVFEQCPAQSGWHVIVGHCYDVCKFYFGVISNLQKSCKQFLYILDGDSPIIHILPIYFIILSLHYVYIIYSTFSIVYIVYIVYTHIHMHIIFSESLASKLKTPCFFTPQ